MGNSLRYPFRKMWVEILRLLKNKWASFNFVFFFAVLFKSQINAYEKLAEQIPVDRVWS